MQTFTYIFLGFLLASTLVQLYLSLRQKAYVSQHRAAVPTPFADKITLTEHQKAADYTLAKGGLGRLESGIGLVLLLLWTLGGGLNWLDQFWRGFGWGELLTGAAVIISFSMIGSLLDIPASLYRTFVLEQRFGFNNMTAQTFVTDLLKGTALALVIGIPLVMLILWLMASAGQYWWLYAWASLTAFSLLMTWAYPQFIAPLFNKFTA